MRRKDLIMTTMALTIAVSMAAAAVGYGSGEPAADNANVAVIEPTETAVTEEMETEVLEDGTSYRSVALAEPYTAVVAKDTKLIGELGDWKNGRADVAKDSYIRVESEVYDGDVLTDYYGVSLQDGSTGYLSGKDIDFNIDYNEVDYADTLVAYQGGDGEADTQEADTESDKADEQGIEKMDDGEVYSVDFNVTPCDPVIKYTNTGANIRELPNKDSRLVGTVGANTEVKVLGTTDTGWTQVESDYMVCYIKSSLLSDSRVEAPEPVASNNGGTSQQEPVAETPAEPVPAEPQPVAGEPAEPQQEQTAEALGKHGFPIIGDDFPTGNHNDEELDPNIDWTSGTWE